MFSVNIKDYLVKIKEKQLSKQEALTFIELKEMKDRLFIINL